MFGGKRALSFPEEREQEDLLDHISLFFVADFWVILNASNI